MGGTNVVAVLVPVAPLAVNAASTPQTNAPRCQPYPARSAEPAPLARRAFGGPLAPGWPPVGPMTVVPGSMMTPRPGTISPLICVTSK